MALCLTKKMHTAEMDLEVVIPMAVSCNPNALIVIRTAVPAGYTESVRDNHGIKNIIYCPELMNESGQSCGRPYPNTNRHRYGFVR